MAGNVWEWNRDWYSSTYYGSSPATDPYDSASASYRVFRGGSFLNGAVYLRAGGRGSGFTPSDAFYYLGLRCMRAAGTPNACANVTCPAIACATNSCDATTGQCVATPVADNTTCDDGNACTTGDVCTSGTCAGTAKSCDDANACTADSCDATSGGCVHTTLATCGPCNVGGPIGCSAGQYCAASGTGVCSGTGTCTALPAGCPALMAPVCGCDGATYANTCYANAAGTNVASTGSCTPAGMVLIPAGTFWMGCNATKDTNCNSDENPQHKVTLSAYYMDLTETTVAQYKACVDAGVCAVPASVQPTTYATYPGLTDHPVNFVSWTQSQQYCQWRGAGFDLPTEAQWEMAARGGCAKNGGGNCSSAMRTYPWGEAAASCTYATMNAGASGCGTNTTWPVGSRPAGDSPYGLHDMAGNVWEWTRDWQGPYSAADQVNPTGPGSGILMIGRGGAFDYTNNLQSSSRCSGGQWDAYAAAGFRCTRSYP